MIPQLWQWPHSTCEACHELPPDVLYTTSEGKRVKLCSCCDTRLLMLKALDEELQAARDILKIVEDVS